jgi:soluble cytochrome b562
MSSNNKKNNKKSSKKETSTNDQENNITSFTQPQENLQAELEKYLKITEGELKTQQEKDELAKKVKKQYEDRLEDIKKLASEGQIEELHKALVDLVRKNNLYFH